MKMRAIIGGLWLTLLILAACGPQGPQIDLRLTVAGQALSSIRGGPAPERGQAPPGIEAFRICVQNASGKKLVCEDFSDLEAGTFRVGGIPAGKDRVVTFQGYVTDPETFERDVLWCGRVTGVDIKHEGVTPVSMLLTLCGDFTETPCLPVQARAFHTATLLEDGRVLIAGGYTALTHSNACSRPCAAFEATRSVEIYDPAEGSFTALGDLSHARGLHAAMRLPHGKVLLAGGCEIASLQSSFADADQPGSPLRCLTPGPAAVTAEIIDPASGATEVFEIPFSLFAGELPVGEERLVLAGGRDLQGKVVDRAVMVDASGGTVNATEIPLVLSAGRRSPTSAVISSPGEQPAEAMLLGGINAPSPTDPGAFAERLIAGSGEVFTHVPGFVEAAAGVGLPVMHAAASRLRPGRLVVAGGVLPGRFLSQDTPFLPQPLSSSAKIDPRTDEFELLDGDHELGIARVFHTLTPVGDSGYALVGGGFIRIDPDADTHHQATASVEGWDDEREGFTLVWLRGAPVEMLLPRAGHSATRLGNGTILISGGLDDRQIQVSAEIFSPFPTKLGSDGLPAL